MLTILEANLASALRISVMRLARRLRSERTDDHLTATATAALATLDRHGPLGPAELAAHERVRPPSMTKVLAGLDERGLIVREPHPTDGRQVLVSLSEQGRELLAADRQRRDVWLAQRLADLSPHERHVLTEAAHILDRLACE